MDKMLMESQYLTEFLVPVNFVLGCVAAIWYLKRLLKNGEAIKWMLFIKFMVIAYLTTGYGLFFFGAISGPLFREACSRPGFFALTTLLIGDCIVAGGRHVSK
jgi:hypothetical protein